MDEIAARVRWLAVRMVDAANHDRTSGDDASSHAMAWLGWAMGVQGIHLRVDAFGQSGSARELYEIHHLTSDAIVNAAIAALALGGPGGR